MESKRYLVTGGLGFLGAPLCRALVNQGHEVRILDDASRGRTDRIADIEDQVDLVQGDIRDPGSVREAVEGVDAVCHLAFVNGTRHFYERPAHVLEVGVKGCVNVLDACVAEDVPELYVASSSEVYQEPPEVPTDESVRMVVPDPLNPRYSYGGGKIITELMALNYGRERLDHVVVFRPHNVYGPDMGWDHVIPEFVRRMVRRRKEVDERPLPFPIKGTGEETRAFVYIDDFTRGLTRVIEDGDHMEIYNVGTEEEVPIRDLAVVVADELDLEVDIEPGPAHEGSTPRRCPDISKVRALGYEPTHKLRDGLAPTVEWYEDHPDPRDAEGGTP